jgi:formylglycine-generating enzyme required for sulfatase activity
MSGNGYEWCWDWYGVYSSGAQIDPKGAAPGAPSESYHVLRGGSFRAGGGVVGGAAVCRVAYRTLDFPSSKGLYYLTPTLLRSHGYGFRCAQN